MSWITSLVHDFDCVILIMTPIVPSYEVVTKGFFSVPHSLTLSLAYYHLSCIMVMYEKSMSCLQNCKPWGFFEGILELREPRFLCHSLNIFVSCHHKDFWH